MEISIPSIKTTPIGSNVVQWWQRETNRGEDSMEVLWCFICRKTTHSMEQVREKGVPVTG